MGWSERRRGWGVYEQVQKFHLGATYNPSERPNRDMKEPDKETEKDDGWNDENSYGEPLDGSSVSKENSNYLSYSSIYSLSIE